MLESCETLIKPVIIMTLPSDIHDIISNKKIYSDFIKSMVWPL